LIYSQTTQSEEETIALGEHLGALLFGGAVVLLDGNLGAGKTRFAQGVARALGVSSIVTSPTFNLVLEYPLDRGQKGDSSGTAGGGAGTERDGAIVPDASWEASGTIAPSLSVPAPPRRPPFCPPRLLRHFDLYRLDNPEQLDDLDYFGLIEEYDAVSLVEWGSKFASMLPLDYILVDIGIDDDEHNQRRIEFSAAGSQSMELLGQFALSEGMERVRASD